MPDQPGTPAGATPTSRPLYAMFNAVPPRYDLVNTALTWNLDRRWRNEAARACLEEAPKRVLDLCCGTGDLAVAVAGLAGEKVEVYGFDFSAPMLALAKQKAQQTGRTVRFVRGDAAAMPFPDNHFDVVGISFAFRNLTYRNPAVARHLAEVLRVLRPGGRFVIVESAQPASRAVRAMYHAYLRSWVAGVGSLLSGERAAYRYLAESAARFYSPEEVERLLREAGFASVRFGRRMLGAVAVYVATK